MKVLSSLKMKGTGVGNRADRLRELSCVEEELWLSV